MFNKIKFLLIFSSVLVASGCVTGTRNIALEVPTTTEKTAVGNIEIVAINDKRVFEQKPKKPEIPSSKSKIDSMSAETKATLIGRQRNGYGGAMGDVAIADGVTVQDQVRELLNNGLSKRGYTIADTADKKLTVDIDKFWAWMVPGFISIGFESEVETTLTLQESGQNKTATASAKANNEGQIASNANWKLTYTRAYEAFLQNLDQALEELGL